jgi:NAD(P)-dependent dehydrogenase (short-subunit alcohol dehydrogenase family)
VKRSALVTGASSGIGAATTDLLSSQGWRVFGASRRPPASAQPGVEWIEMDVRDEASVRAGVALASGRAGQLDALVCNAGFGIFGSIEEVSLATVREQFDTNVFGVLACVRAVLPDFRSRRAGRIVLVGSLAGRAPIPFQAHYSATKAAVDSLAQVLRMELAPFGVGVSLVEPGDIRTAFNDATDFSRATRSVYGARIARCEGVIRRSLDRAPGPSVVARAIVRALTARHPRTRYPVGPDSRLVPLGRRILPDWITQRLVRQHFQV